MADSDIENLDVWGSLDIQPYQFKPLLDENISDNISNSSSEDSEIDNLTEAESRLTNTNWWVLSDFIRKYAISRRFHVSPINAHQFPSSVVGYDSWN